MASSSLVALLVPLAIAAALFAFLTFVLAPLIRRYRTRYDQYTPLAGISSLRDRISLLLSGWGRRVVRTDAADENDDDAGEEMYDFPPDDPGRPV